MFHPGNRGWQRSLTVSIFIVVGLVLASFIGHRVTLDAAIFVAFACGVAACWLIIFVIVKWE